MTICIGHENPQAVLDGLDEEEDGTVIDDVDDFAAGDIEMDY